MASQGAESWRNDDSQAGCGFMPCVTMNGDFQQIQGGRQISLSHPYLRDSLNLWEKTQFTKGDDLQYSPPGCARTSGMGFTRQKPGGPAVRAC